MTVRPIRRLLVALLALGALVGVLAACTKSSPSGPSQTTNDGTVTHSSSAGPTGPLSTSPIVATTVGACPYLAIEAAKSHAGMRLDRITKLTQDGKTVGCRFYPSSYLAGSERLPPTSQLAVEIISTKYASALAAHNAFVLRAEKGTNVQPEVITSTITGLCFQSTVWSHDNGKDWSCTFNVGATMVLIRTVVTDPALNVVDIAKAIVGEF